jgi:hypothetical protein
MTESLYLLDVSEELETSLPNHQTQERKNEILTSNFELPNPFYSESFSQPSNMLSPKQPNTLTSRPTVDELPPIHSSGDRPFVDAQVPRAFVPLFQSQISMTETPNKYSVFEDLDRQLKEAKTNSINDVNLAINEGMPESYYLEILETKEKYCQSKEIPSLRVKYNAQKSTNL